MRRFFIQTPESIPCVQYFTTEDEKYIKKVLRLQNGDKIMCFNGKGIIYEGTLTANINGKQIGVYLEKEEKIEENKKKSSIIVSAIKADRLEFLIEKCTEIGIDEIIVTETQFSNENIDYLKKKLNRLEKIIISASRQSERIYLTKLSFLSYSQVLEYFSKIENKYICTTEFKAKNIKEVISSESKDNVCWIGPEGGFNKIELASIIDLGFKPCRLGANILRSETAAMIASYELVNN